MFSGRWEQSLDHDSHGRIFLDFEPYCFKQILTSLRCRRLQMGQEEKVSAPVVEQGMQQPYACLVEYLGLKDVLGQCVSTHDAKTCDGLNFALASKHFLVHKAMVEGQWTERAEVQLDAFYSGRCPPRHAAWVMAGPNMRPGQVYYLKMQCKRKPSFIGIAKDGQCQQDCPSATAFGWSHDALWRSPKTFCWSAGASTEVPFASRFPVRFVLQADLITGQLTCMDLDAVVKRTIISYSMQVPIPSQSQQSYMFQVTTFYDNQLRLLPVSDADKQLFAETSCCA